MRIEYQVRVLAGSLVLASLLLALAGNRYWLWVAAFVGVNLIQSAFTGFCPAEKILCRLGAKSPA